ncbi:MULTISPECIES: tRNA uridine(34) 5-carboxymethylaminomethyl modification radical SAM/GNAT enzyme Elp3 [unclassified Methanoregula]|uniref:tRNA uridine(34) 5-carboxymethylaminomethyl modification radical SAM/GNAT enzyme Elp3 n=1 Tax=unclassified Methanoregula TaxID=2649730 RepID=UPI0009CFE3FA|nr:MULTISPECIES: tRNA uridine(34) 5-carboxymethylaminomethyl modification radical SAM/GNAT enzyme Elp3 [unclassified Methanoregula]OPX63361.1 MAG: coproporphyrinogen III oxidase [Methanoregula sp. PtaB.Bin085]OPY35035.1 MAG: coproporphyrinogen III oxidase [Methanoregula sp. PtaU1.Bin006]
MDEVTAYREIISRILSLSETGEEAVRSAKIAVCRKYSLPAVPKNSAILAAALPEEREILRRVLMVKPSRTLSGVAPVAVMTSPYPCPHGKCLPCPGGPDHPFHSPQSYTGEEPAAKRAREHDFDPFRQVQARLGQFETLGHRVEKVELIVMGGTMTARPAEYQQEFVARCIEAMNTYPCGTPATEAPAVREVGDANEQADIRCVAITFETRPDWCRREHIDRMLDLGVTKVELGVQHVDDAILSFNRRGCTVADTVEANTLLRDAGLKVGFHMMPNLPGSDMASDRRMFETLFDDPRFRPDFLKLYPTLVTPGTEIEALWKEGKYSPYAEDELVDLIAYAKSLIPEYTRLQRIQRDIPAKLIVAGSKHSNFRQLAKNRLLASGKRCRCIRCREIGRAPSPAESRIRDLQYEACKGTEHFVSAVSGDSLIGFARLRFPSSVYREELENAAVMRELHVYGSLVPVGKDAETEEWQHREYGKALLGRAEEIARDAGFRRLAIMSGIGVRPYYRRQGYERRGPYMGKELS